LLLRLCTHQLLVVCGASQAMGAGLLTFSDGTNGRPRQEGLTRQQAPQAFLL
jgi:hypothetical protein